jgi:hypothetical protein
MASALDLARRPNVRLLTMELNHIRIGIKPAATRSGESKRRSSGRAEGPTRLAFGGDGE